MTGIVFCVFYLSVIAYYTPYLDGMDNFFSMICQVQTLFLLLASLLMLLNGQLKSANWMIESLDGPSMDNASGEAWFGTSGASASVTHCVQRVPPPELRTSSSPRAPSRITRELRGVDGLLAGVHLDPSGCE